MERIKEIDNNDKLYLSIMKEPIFNTSFSLDQYYEELEAFVFNIFSQPVEKAYRRNRTYWGHIAERVAYSGARDRVLRLHILHWIQFLFKFLPFKETYKKIENNIIFYEKL